MVSVSERSAICVNKVLDLNTAGQLKSNWFYICDTMNLVV